MPRKRADGEAQQGLEISRVPVTLRPVSYKGIIENGQIKLPPDAMLPEGAEVTVEVVEETPIAPFAAELLKLCKARDWPADMALNHDHYLYGTPTE